MTDSYASISLSRPRIKHDVLFVQTPGGVLFHDSQGGFQLNAKSAYQLASLIVPYMNGRHTVEQLCASLGDDQRTMVADLAAALLDRGFARDAEAPGSAPDGAACTPAEAERFAAQVNYIAHYRDRSEERFTAFRRSRVAVLGGDAVARWCVLGLLRNGASAIGVQAALRAAGPDFAEVEAEAAELAAAQCPVELIPLPSPAGSATGTDLTWDDLAGFDTVVVGADGAGVRQLLSLVRAGVPEGVRLLPAATIGGQAVVGPLMTAGRSGCWICAVLRIGANGEPGAAAQVWTGLIVPDTGPRPGRQLAAMLGNLLAYEVFRAVTGVVAPETEGTVICQDLESMDAFTQPLAPHPACPVCGPGLAPDAAAVSGAEPRTAVTSAPEDAEDTSARSAELDAVAALVGHRTGVFTRFADERFTQLPLKVGRVELGLGDTRRRTVTAFDVHHAVGARLNALTRAAEVYAEHVVPLAVTAGDEDPAARVEPGRLDVHSGTGAGVADVHGWVAATSLMSQRPVLVPAAAVQPFGRANAERYFLATSAGTGAGRTAGQAVDRGLLSALGLRALVRAVRRTDPVASVVPDGLADDPELDYLLKSARNLGLEPELLHLAGEGAEPSLLLARAAGPDGGPPLWALGARLEWQQAALVALRDLIGPAQVRQDPAAEADVDTGDPLLAAFDPYALAAERKVEAELGRRVTWPQVLEGLRTAGQEAYAVPTATADLTGGGLTTVRVLLAGRD
jgi:bacteriocin biosynthesis cyclodehydratase domain-containing protein